MLIIVLEIITKMMNTLMIYAKCYENDKLIANSKDIIFTNKNGQIHCLIQSWDS
eukprot:gene11470-4634_t